MKCKMHYEEIGCGFLNSRVKSMTEQDIMKLSKELRRFKREIDEILALEVEEGRNLCWCINVLFTMRHDMKGHSG